MLQAQKKAQAAISEKEKEFANKNRVVQTAKTRINNLKKQVEDLTAENKAQKSKITSTESNTGQQNMNYSL